MQSTGLGFSPQAHSTQSSPPGVGPASLVGDTPSSGAPAHRTKRNKTIAAAPPVFLQGRPVTGIDQHGNANTVYVHHTPPSKTQRYNLASSSSDDDDPYSQSGASEDNAG
jgi:hypothetical protein